MFVNLSSNLELNQLWLHTFTTLENSWWSLGVMNGQLQYFVPGLDVREVAWTSNGGFCSEKHLHFRRDLNNISYSVQIVVICHIWLLMVSEDISTTLQTVQYEVIHFLIPYNILIMKLFKDCVFEQRKFQGCWSCNMMSGAWLLPRTNDQPCAHKLHRVILVRDFNS